MNKSLSLNDKAIFCKTSGAPNSPKTRLVYVCVWISPLRSVEPIWSTTSDVVYCFGTWSEELLITYTPEHPAPATFSSSVFPSPHHYHTLTRPWLLLIIMSPTSYCSPHHLFTEPDNEPHWAVIGFHGVTRGVFLLIGHLCIWLPLFLEREISIQTMWKSFFSFSFQYSSGL